MLGAAAVAVLGWSNQVDPLAPLPATPPPSPMILAQPSATYQAPGTYTGVAAYKQRLAGLARSAGVREATIQAVVPYLSVNSRVIQLDQAQRPTSTSGSAPASFGPYVERHITRSLINRGYARYAGRWANLSRIRQK